MYLYIDHPNPLGRELTISSSYSLRRMPHFGYYTIYLALISGKHEPVSFTRGYSTRLFSMNQLFIDILSIVD